MCYFLVLINFIFPIWYLLVKPNKTDPHCLRHSFFNFTTGIYNMNYYQGHSGPNFDWQEIQEQSLIWQNLVELEDPDVVIARESNDLWFVMGDDVQELKEEFRDAGKLVHIQKDNIDLIEKYTDHSDMNAQEGTVKLRKVFIVFLLRK